MRTLRKTLATLQAGMATVVAGVRKLLLYAVALIAPREADLWVFGCNGGTRFAENSKYLYLHTANEHAGEVRAVWLSRRWDVIGDLRERGYEAYHIDTLRGTYYALRAGSAFITHSLNDVGMAPAIGARVVNLWHGVPLKRISLDDGYYVERMGRLNWLKTRLLYRSYDHVVTTTTNLTSQFASAFAVAERAVVALGYPRNDALVTDIDGADIGSDDAALSDLRELGADDDVVAYVPTWRETGGNPIADADLDLDALDATLARHDAVLALKFHPATEIAFDDDAFERIVQLPAELDAHPVLRVADVLITDYSSVYFDFLLLDRPVVFFPYDLERYLAEDREFYFAYDDVTPGPKPTDGEELRAALASALDDPEAFADERAAVRAEFFEDPDGNAAERVYAFFRERSSEA